MSENPYASSATPLQHDALHPPEIILASRFKRFIARIVDGILDSLLLWICTLLIPALRDLRMRDSENSASDLDELKLEFWHAFAVTEITIESVALWFIAIGITFVLQAYLLAKYGQTIGKRMLKIMIVNTDGYRKPSLSRSFGVREGGMYVLQWIPFLTLLDALWIFGERRKCLHDHWSRTIVINAIN